MAQEFTIKSSQIENKINQLLPSQGGFQPGVDFSASTMVVPIVDLTETAEGSSLRQDLQSSLSLTSITDFDVVNSSSVIINTTGYFRIFGTSTVLTNGLVVNDNSFTITDGATTKNLFQHSVCATDTRTMSTVHYDFIVLLEAGHSVSAVSNGAANVAHLTGCTRQIADLSKNLINP